MEMLTDSLGCLFLQWKPKKHLLLMSSLWHNWTHYQLLQSSLEKALDKIHCWVKSDVSPNLVGPKKWRVASSPTGTGDMNSLLKVTVSCEAYKWLCQRSCRMRCWGSFIESTKALLGWKQLQGVMCGGLVWTSFWKMLPKIAECASQWRVLQQ